MAKSARTNEKCKPYGFSRRYDLSLIQLSQYNTLRSVPSVLRLTFRDEHNALVNARSFIAVKGQHLRDIIFCS